MFYIKILLIALVICVLYVCAFPIILLVLLGLKIRGWFHALVDRFLLIECAECGCSIEWKESFVMRDGFYYHKDCKDLQ